MRRDDDENEKEGEAGKAMSFRSFFFVKSHTRMQSSSSSVRNWPTSISSFFFFFFDDVARVLLEEAVHEIEAVSTHAHVCTTSCVHV